MKTAKILKVMKIGEGYAVTVPAEAARQLDLKKGTRLLVVVDHEKQTLLYRKIPSELVEG